MLSHQHAIATVHCQIPKNRQHDDHTGLESEHWLQEMGYIQPAPKAPMRITCKPPRQNTQWIGAHHEASPGGKLYITESYLHRPRPHGKISPLYSLPMLSGLHQTNIHTRIPRYVFFPVKRSEVSLFVTFLCCCVYIHGQHARTALLVSKHLRLLCQAVAGQAYLLLVNNTLGLCLISVLSYPCA